MRKTEKERARTKGRPSVSSGKRVLPKEDGANEEQREPKNEEEENEKEEEDEEEVTTSHRRHVLPPTAARARSRGTPPSDRFWTSQP